MTTLQVAIGLIREMIAQVDQLAEGMSEVPEQVLTLQPRFCLVSKIRAHSIKRKKEHAWDSLPGGREAALERVVARPANFVTRLNPKKDDAWTFPDLVSTPEKPENSKAYMSLGTTPFVFGFQTD